MCHAVAEMNGHNQIDVQLMRGSREARLRSCSVS